MTDEPINPWQGLTSRLLGIAAFLGLLATFGLAPMLIQMNLTTHMQRTANLLGRIMDGPEGDACRASPDTWELRTEDGMRVRAFDYATVAGLGPDQARPDEELLVRLREGNNRVGRLFVRGEQEGAMLIRAKEDGPCSLLQARWPKRSTSRSRELGLILGLTFVAVTIAGALGGSLTVIPVLRRISQRPPQAEV